MFRRGKHLPVGIADNREIRIHCDVGEAEINVRVKIRQLSHENARCFSRRLGRGNDGTKTRCIVPGGCWLMPEVEL